MALLEAGIRWVGRFYPSQWGEARLLLGFGVLAEAFFQ